MSYELPVDMTAWTAVVGAVEPEMQYEDSTKQRVDWLTGQPRFRVRLIVLAPIFDSVDVMVAGDVSGLKPGTRVRAEGGRYRKWSMNGSTGVKLWVDALVPVETTTARGAG